MPKRQLGATKYIRLGLIPISLGIFLELSGSATADLTVSSYCYWLQIAVYFSSSSLLVNVFFFSSFDPCSEQLSLESLHVDISINVV